MSLRPVCVCVCVKMRCFENFMHTHLFFSSSLCVDLQEEEKKKMLSNLKANVKQEE